LVKLDLNREKISHKTLVGFDDEIIEDVKIDFDRNKDRLRKSGITSFSAMALESLLFTFAHLDEFLQERDTRYGRTRLSQREAVNASIRKKSSS